MYSDPLTHSLTRSLTHSLTRSLAAGELPEVTVSGSRSELLLTFALPPHLYHDLPLTLRSSRGVKVHPVLFNKGTEAR